jgi:hypothetical protein
MYVGARGRSDENAAFIQIGRGPGLAPIPPIAHGIGLGLRLAGISINSARGPETTGNDRYQPGNAHTRAGRPALEPGGPPSALVTGKTPGQASGRGGR